MHDLTPPDNVITTAELRAHGMTTHAIAMRCRPSGPWQRILPGVVLMSASRPTRRQRLRAAVAYGGPEAVVSGIDAMRAHGIDVPLQPDIRVLVPSTRRLAGRSYLTVERTIRPPKPAIKAHLPYAPLARATLDASRRAADHDQLRTLLTSVIGQCTVAELRAELDAGSQRGSAAVRALLSEDLAAPNEVVPVAVAQAKRVLRTTALPSARWREPVHDGNGMLLGIPDAWWPEVSLAWDVGPQACHHDPRVWAAGGVTLLRTDPGRLSTASSTVGNELIEAFARAAAKPGRRAG